MICLESLLRYVVMFLSSPASTSPPVEKLLMQLGDRFKVTNKEQRSVPKALKTDSLRAWLFFLVVLRGHVPNRFSYPNLIGRNARRPRAHLAPAFRNYC